LLVDRIDAVLPQTQCTKCGFDGCRPYAQAIAQGEAGIDRCPPGGEAGVVSLAALLGQSVVPLDLSRGLPGPLKVAVIDERHCIGCTLCIQACPVDAILGANKHMHTVLPDLCTGCDLCVAPCPVDCIDMVAVAPARPWTGTDADLARSHYQLRNQRLDRARLQQEARPQAKAQTHTPSGDPDAARKRDMLDAALARARARRAH
jgi:electron transport complex protein RnfB